GRSARPIGTTRTVRPGGASVAVAQGFQAHDAAFLEDHLAHQPPGAQSVDPDFHRDFHPGTLMDLQFAARRVLPLAAAHEASAPGDALPQDAALLHPVGLTTQAGHAGRMTPLPDDA